MATPHISAKPGEIAKTVLMPGDPLRAEFIAKNFLEKPRCVNKVRGMLAFSGICRGREVTVMGSGMGMPSMGIYSYELFTQYGVEKIIRVGSGGAYSEKLALYDVVLSTGAYSESSYAKTQSGFEGDIILPSEALCGELRNSAKKLGIAMAEGILHSSDVFYRQPAEEGKPYWQKLRDEKGCLAVEMEAFALFHNAIVCGKQAAALVTISDSFVSRQATTSEEREKSFTDMIEIALECAI